MMGPAEIRYLLWSPYMGSWKTGRSQQRIRIFNKVSSLGSWSVVPTQERRVEVLYWLLLPKFRLARKKNICENLFFILWLGLKFAFRCPLVIVSFPPRDSLVCSENLVWLLPAWGMQVVGSERVGSSTVISLGALKIWPDRNVGWISLTVMSYWL